MRVEDGVKFVLKSFERMYGGEIFIPKTNSIKILDIAKSIDPKAKIKIIGIRPGEKLHEILCPQDEAHLTLEYRNYFMIKPSIGLDVKNNYKRNPLGESGKAVLKNFEYTSLKNTFLSVSEIKKLIN